MFRFIILLFFVLFFSHVDIGYILYLQSDNSNKLHHIHIMFVLFHVDTGYILYLQSDNSNKLHHKYIMFIFISRRDRIYPVCTSSK